MALLGQSRIYVTLGREMLVPLWLARVSDKTGTPVNATMVTMVRKRGKEAVEKSEDYEVVWVRGEGKELYVS